MYSFYPLKVLGQNDCSSDTCTKSGTLILQYASGLSSTYQLKKGGVVTLNNIDLILPFSNSMIVPHP